MEMLITNPFGMGVRDLLETNAGHGAKKYVAMLGSIGIFVLICNLDQSGSGIRVAHRANFGSVWRARVLSSCITTLLAS